MAKMKLYYSPGSPYARKVRVLAMETGLDRKIEMVNVVVSPIVPNADVDMHNPIGKIPALAVKGMNLFDSPVICEYLDSQHKGRKLLPRKGRERWVALRLQAMADGPGSSMPRSSRATRARSGRRTSTGPTGSRARPRRSRACSPNSRPRPSR